MTLPPSRTRAKSVPMIDARIERPPIASGKSQRCVPVVAAPPVMPSSITATAVTAYVSNRSAAMPAQSPTLSPTLSAITAGLRGSSSGMPASILPTRSAPTSAAFVKMPPPRRAKTEMSEPPNARPSRSLIAECGVWPSQSVSTQ